MLVIFDCDGVLADTESLYADVFTKELAKLGYGLSVHECLSLLSGLTLTRCYEVIETHFSCQLPSDFPDAICTSTEEIVRHALKPSHGVEQLLHHLKIHAIPVCVASNGDTQRVKATVKSVGFETFFGDNIFCADQVAKPKPAPDVFLHAAENMGFKAHESVVIEDSDVGVQAAMSAGMRVMRFDPGQKFESINGVEKFKRFDEIKQNLGLQ